MTKISLLFICSFFLITGFAQDYPNLISSSTVSTIAYWNKGDKATYKVSKKKKSFRNTSLAAESSEDYKLDLIVADSTEKSYKIHMTYSGFGSNSTKSAVENKLLALQNGLTVKYKTDENGIFQEILNLDELNKGIQRKLSDLKKEVAADIKLSEDEKTSYKQMIELVEITYGRVEITETLFIEEILAIHGYYGYEFKLNDPVVSEIEFPVFTGKALPGLATIKLTNINKSTDRFTLSISQEPDKEELEKYIMKMVKMFIPESKKDLKRTEMDLKLQSSITYEMTLSSGWITKMTNISKADITADSEKRKTEQTITFIRQ